MKSGSRARTQRYVIGVDFGTLSARAVLVSISNGREVAAAVHNYRHGVIERSLPGTNKVLPPDTALQHPADYVESLSKIIPRVLKIAGVNASQIIGLGTDFTCCTILPTRLDGTPLCFDSKWKKNPHAWVKLWKHHAAQQEANEINSVGLERNELFVRTYGGKYSSEWFFSKVLETVRKAPEVYAAADRFIEAGDWIVSQLCGEESRNLSSAGFKAMWVYPDGNDGSAYPDKEFFRALDSRMENIVAEKLSTRLKPLGSRAGGLTRDIAARIGLLEGTPVAVGNIDAHVAVPACGITTPGKMLMIMGTSTCHLLMGAARHEVEGMCGVVKDGVVSGWWGYEAGQAGVGDLFAWFVNHGASAEVAKEAKRKKVSVYAQLESGAAKLRPGENGLLVLDWWNGNRSVLVDADLTGLLVGATLATRSHEIYRSCMEATAFGTRKIIEAFTSKGVPIDELYACGGLAKNSPLLMQIYADVTGRPIRVASSEQACALGSAIHAAVAAGAYENVHAAAQRMACKASRQYKPNRRHAEVYNRLYAEYSRLHDYFGRDPQGTMKILKQLKMQAFSR